MSSPSNLVTIKEDIGCLIFSVQLPYKYDVDLEGHIIDDIRDHVITLVGDDHWNMDIEDSYMNETDKGTFEFCIEISTPNHDKQQIIYDKVVEAARSFVLPENTAKVLVEL